jgi:hypothetical protein
MPSATDDLKSQLQSGNVVPVVGAGTSAAIAGLPGWAGLIRSGIDFAEGSGSCTPAKAASARRKLEAGKMLAAAQALKKLLRAPGGQYAGWLEHTFENPTIHPNPGPAGPLADLLCPLVATTNYDVLLERLLLGRFESATWRQPQRLLKALQRGEMVLHLHGIYSDPKSVVLGVDNYEELVRDPAYRTVLQTLWIERTLLFIGCSFSGLEDPDFSRMMSWFKETFPGVSQRHYVLMLEDSFTAEERAKWLHDWRIKVIPYGPSHAQLPSVLRELNPNSQRAYARRIRLSKQLLEEGNPANIPEFVSLLEGAGSQMPFDELRETAATLFRQLQNQRLRMRQNLSAMQSLTRSMVNVDRIREESASWRRGAKYEGAFWETVQRAARTRALSRSGTACGSNENGRSSQNPKRSPRQNP